MADGAIFKLFDGVLADSVLDGAVDIFKFLSFGIGKDSWGGVVFGMFAHGFCVKFIIDSMIMCMNLGLLYVLWSIYELQRSNEKISALDLDVF